MWIREVDLRWSSDHPPTIRTTDSLCCMVEVLCVQNSTSVRRCVGFLIFIKSDVDAAAWDFPSITVSILHNNHILWHLQMIGRVRLRLLSWSHVTVRTMDSSADPLWHGMIKHGPCLPPRVYFIKRTFIPVHRTQVLSQMHIHAFKMFKLGCLSNWRSH